MVLVLWLISGDREQPLSFFRFSPADPEGIGSGGKTWAAVFVRTVPDPFRVWIFSILFFSLLFFFSVFLFPIFYIFYFLYFYLLILLVIRFIFWHGYFSLFNFCCYFSFLLLLLLLPCCLRILVYKSRKQYVVLFWQGTWRLPDGM
ncbi:uncharacterized protein BDW47DRAFT_95014 [Aspergillus candidus]|uniref:Uncharacterized protein n=1 Tax=Aspergillus candidus TaxID=41067 RepID=A0A2I2EYN0_ASPCN|nr:hypothetical protein BDW47DRAFT_95014 [Aspergillus candidus]PLB33484.1 hypothetical protein BDW47DRAFT_95014 [Aspergillus candidus]